MYAVQQHLGINAGIIKMICEGINRCKSGNSKKDGQRYKFEYINPETTPHDYKKSTQTGQKRQKLLTDVDEKLHVMKFGRKPYGPFRYNTNEERKQARKAKKQDIFSLSQGIVTYALISTIIHLLEKPGI